MAIKDAFGNEIKVGSKIVHSAQYGSHRHRLRIGMVTRFTVTEHVTGAGQPWERRYQTCIVHYAASDGSNRYARRLNLVAVVE